MNKSRKEINLKYRGNTFPSEKWFDFLKYFNADKSSGRSTDEFPIWNVIRGKGYQIWISDPVLRWDDENAYWLIAISTSKNLSTVGYEQLNELIDSSLIKFLGIEIFKEDKK